MFRITLLSICFSLFACKSIAPTPLLIDDLIKDNNEIHSIYESCVLNSTQCDVPELVGKIKIAQDKAKFFIGGDIKQPHGYDIYLQLTLIYFSVSEANKDELTEAERIARQFFEIQKASSGRALQIARYYWVMFMAENLSYDWRSGERNISEERKVEIVLCLSEASLALDKMEDGVKTIRLHQAMQVLIVISRSL